MTMHGSTVLLWLVVVLVGVALLDGFTGEPSTPPWREPEDPDEDND